MVVDLETTGGSPRDSRITEIGAVKVIGGERVGTFHALVDPEEPIPPFISHLTGIDDRLVRGEPSIEAVLPAFVEFARGAVFVAHNARFDFSFLNENLRSARLSGLGRAARLHREACAPGRVARGPQCSPADARPIFPDTCEADPPSARRRDGVRRGPGRAPRSRGPARHPDARRPPRSRSRSRPTATTARSGSPMLSPMPPACIDSWAGTTASSTWGRLATSARV